MLVRLEKYLLLGSGIRTVGGDTAFRRERSGVPHASPETPLAFATGSVSRALIVGGARRLCRDLFGDGWRQVFARFGA